MRDARDSSSNVNDGRQPALPPVLEAVRPSPRARPRRVAPAVLALAAGLIVGVYASTGRCSPIIDQGRQVFQKYSHAVVTVEIAVKTTFMEGGQNSPGREMRRDLTGTVIDPSGLTVLSLSELDPMSMYRRFMPVDARFKMNTQISDVKLLLSDDTELPAEVVLRDQDLDLAFIRPKTKPAKPLTAVDLHDAGTAQLLDEVIAINRLGRAVDRAYSAAIEHIAAVVHQPRLFYVPDSTMTATGMGSPVFLPTGKLLGVVVMRVIGGRNGSMSEIIVPAKDILKGAQQVPQAGGTVKP